MRQLYLCIWWEAHYQQYVRHGMSHILANLYGVPDRVHFGRSFDRRPVWQFDI